MLNIEIILQNSDLRKPRAQNTEHLNFLGNFDTQPLYTDIKYTQFMTTTQLTQSVYNSRLTNSTQCSFFAVKSGNRFVSNDFVKLTVIILKILVRWKICNRMTL